ncbi:MAG: D-tyrosyl-tRNA(Tyr) deacylase [Candidatus Pacebacteria bacterium]|nr:D-tyrosyl-tRNA(Tyr) deacylase [Candidatus Paceibacterota bacterium]
MRAVIQRSLKAKVFLGSGESSSIESGLVVLLAVSKEDNLSVALKMAEKLVKLRIFSDENDKMNLNILDVKGEILLISQFTLYADTKKGNRPSFLESALPEPASKLFKAVTEKIIEKGVKVKTGFFGQMMNVSLVNNGPTTIILDIDSKKEKV